MADEWSGCPCERGYQVSLKALLFILGSLLSKIVISLLLQMSSCLSSNPLFLRRVPWSHQLKTWLQQKLYRQVLTCRILYECLSFHQLPRKIHPGSYSFHIYLTPKALFICCCGKLLEIRHSYSLQTFGIVVYSVVFLYGVLLSSSRSHCFQQTLFAFQILLGFRAMWVLI